MGATAKSAAGNGADIAHIGHAIEYYDKRTFTFFYYLVYYILQVVIIDETGEGYYALVVGLGETQQFGLGYFLERNHPVAGQLFDGFDGIAGGASLDEYFFYAFAGFQRFYNGLTAYDDRGSVLRSLHEKEFKKNAGI
jgi:hypothetical protein